MQFSFFAIFIFFTVPNDHRAAEHGLVVLLRFELLGCLLPVLSSLYYTNERRIKFCRLVNHLKKEIKIPELYFLFSRLNAVYKIN